MALQFQYQTTMGFTAQAAYARITGFNGDKLSTICNIDVYNDSTAAHNGLQPIGYIQSLLVLPDGGNMSQMYDALKLDGNFAGAIDC